MANPNGGAIGPSFQDVKAQALAGSRSSGLVFVHLSEHLGGNKRLITKGGPGALEWEPNRFGDLVLQIEARTRDKLVNGVFFRAVPGDFLNGYEVQIFHACYNRDPAKSARYSTGTINDRQLARRSVVNPISILTLRYFRTSSRVRGFPTSISQAVRVSYASRRTP